MLNSLQIIISCVLKINYYKQLYISFFILWSIKIGVLDNKNTFIQHWLHMKLNGII